MQNDLNFFVEIIPGALLFVISLVSFAKSVKSAKNIQENLNHQLSECNEVDNNLMKYDKTEFSKDSVDDLIDSFEHYHQIVSSSSASNSGEEIIAAIGEYAHDKSEFIQNLKLENNSDVENNSDIENDLENKSFYDEYLNAQEFKFKFKDGLSVNEYKPLNDDHFYQFKTAK